MKVLSLAVAIAAAVLPAHGLAQGPVDRTASLPSITFPKLTAIYFASGVLDSGDADNDGNATVVHCSNTGAAEAQVRFLFHNDAGVLKGSHQLDLPGKSTRTVATHGVNVFGDVPVGTGAIVQGRLTVQSTQSAVFCSAVVVDAAASAPIGIPLHMVRLKAHPNTVE